MTQDASRQRARVDAVMWNLRIDAATADVVVALRELGIESVVLKGPALAGWYPPDSARTYVDGDIWVAPALVARAEALLAERGFVATQDDSGLPEWWTDHGSSWRRERDGGVIDLHRRLQGVGVDPAVAWQTLWQRTVPLELAGITAQMLDEAGRAVYVTLHATHHGTQDPRGLPHLEAALDAVSQQTWEAALDLAARLDALESFSTGLRLLPAGASLAERIAVPDVRSVSAALHASSPPPVALGFEQLAGASWSRRFAIVTRKLFPPPGFVRHWRPQAARNRRSLVLAYLYRPFWLLRQAPGGYRAWRQARRAVKSSR